MSEESTSNEQREDRLILDDTPENRAWIGEAEPQPIEKDSDKR